MNNKVELIGTYGNDETHALSAWCSTSRELSEEKKGRVGKLLSQLAEAGHHTPFEKSSLHFLITTDISTHIQLLKHRIGISINSESARYKEIKEDNFLIPNDWPIEWKNALEAYTQEGLELYHKCLHSLVKEHGFDKKRAKESARFFRTYNTQIQCDIMFNFRSFVHFLELRNSMDAQVEIREIAQQMLTLIKNSGNFNLTIDAFKL